MKIDYQEFIDVTTDVLEAALKDLATGIKGNLRTLAGDIAKQVAGLPSAPKDDQAAIRRSLLNSTKLLAEKSYQMTVNTGWATFSAVVNTAAEFALKVLV